jgi:hypothetical protein
MIDRWIVFSIRPAAFGKLFSCCVAILSAGDGFQTVSLCIAEQLQLGEEFQVRLLIDSAITAFQLEQQALDNQQYAATLFEVGVVGGGGRHATPILGINI